MKITLTQQQKEYIAGMLAGFLDQTNQPLAGNHPLAVQTALFEELADMHKAWEGVGWPDRTMMQIAVAQGIGFAFNQVQNRMRDALKQFGDKLK